MTADLVFSIAERAVRRGILVGVAESLTCGLLVSTLGQGPDAARWLHGGVIAYSTNVKQQLLGVAEGRVVTARCAGEMARGAARLLSADIAISTTGVGGPDPAEGRPPGTVFLGWSAGSQSGSVLHHFQGDPDSILQQTVRAALQLLLTLLNKDEPDPGSAST